MFFSFSFRVFKVSHTFIFILFISHIQLNTAQSYPTQHSTILSNSTQHNPIQLNTAQSNPTQHSTIQSNSTQHNPIQLNTAQPNPTQHSTIQSNPTQHSTIHHIMTRYPLSGKRQFSGSFLYSWLLLFQRNWLSLDHISGRNGPNAPKQT